MTKQELLGIVNNSQLESHDKDVFLSLVTNENDVLSDEVQVKILETVQSIIEHIADKEGITLSKMDNTQQIDEVFKREIEFAEKLLSKLDIAERDLEIAHTSRS